MIQLIRTDSENNDFKNLVRLLDAELALRDGEEHEFFAQINKTSVLKHVIVAYINDEPVACGSLKQYNDETLEVKRMYVPATHRRGGYASAVLSELEKWASELGFSKLVLETGKNQPEAIGLYTKMGYEVTANYGQYIGVHSSVCFRKNL